MGGVRKCHSARGRCRDAAPVWTSPARPLCKLLLTPLLIVLPFSPALLLALSPSPFAPPPLSPSSCHLTLPFPATPVRISPPPRPFSHLLINIHPGSAPQSRSPSPAGADSLTLRALVSTKEAGVIIGKGGKNVAELREQTGVKAGVSKVIPGVHERVLTVTGSVEGVAKVRQTCLGQSMRC